MEFIGNIRNFSNQSKPSETPSESKGSVQGRAYSNLTNENQKPKADEIAKTNLHQAKTIISVQNTELNGKTSYKSNITGDKLTKKDYREAESKISYIINIGNIENIDPNVLKKFTFTFVDSNHNETHSKPDELIGNSNLHGNFKNARNVRISFELDSGKIIYVDPNSQLNQLLLAKLKLYIAYRIQLKNKKEDKKENASLLNLQMNNAQNNKLPEPKPPKPKIVDVVYSEGKFNSDVPTILKLLELKFMEDLKEEEDKEEVEKHLAKIKIALLKQDRKQDVAEDKIKLSEIKKDIEAH